MSYKNILNLVPTMQSISLVKENINKPKKEWLWKKEFVQTKEEQVVTKQKKQDKGEEDE